MRSKTPEPGSDDRPHSEEERYAIIASPSQKRLIAQSPAHYISSFETALAASSGIIVLNPTTVLATTPSQPWRPRPSPVVRVRVIQGILFSEGSVWLLVFGDLARSCPQLF